MQRHRAIGVYDMSLGGALLFAIWGLLPDRWWPVDVPGTLVGALLIVVGVGLIVGARWARRAAAVLSGFIAVAGACLIMALALTAGQLAGMYGPVGTGGAAVLTVVFLLLFPYLVVFPAAQVFFLVGARRDA